MSFGVLFGVGLATSLYCAAMCGGICLSQCAGSLHPGCSNLLYNLGRLASYTIVGGLAGTLGSALAFTPAMKAAI